MPTATKSAEESATKSADLTTQSDAKSTKKSAAKPAKVVAKAAEKVVEKVVEKTTEKVAKPDAKPATKSAEKSKKPAAKSKKPTSNTSIFYATGKRKTSIARVYMSKTSGKGKFIVNNQPINKYFGRETSTMIVNQPLETLSIKGKFNFKVSVKGGGDTGQAGAIRLGITRALMKYDQDLRPELRAAGFVTRDSRIVERKKVGHKKARKNEQYSKR